MAEDAFAVARRGARRANASAKRSKQLQVRLTEQEFTMLDAVSRMQGVSKQAVLMRALLTGGPDAAARYERLREELAGARFLLSNVANNLNQLSHQANAFALTGGTPVSADEVRFAVDAAHAAVAQINAVTGQVN